MTTDRIRERAEQIEKAIWNAPSGSRIADVIESAIREEVERLHGELMALAEELSSAHDGTTKGPGCRFSAEKIRALLK